MKIGLLVDGRAEYYSLPYLLPRLGSPHQVLNPLVCDIQPFASPAQMALAASKKFPILLARGVETIIVLIDKETRPDCTVELVQAVEREAKSRLASLSTTVDLQVVLKVSMFENWLVADPRALGDLAGLFEKVERIEKQVLKGRADAVDALGLLNACSRQRSYDKMAGAVAICKRLDPVRAAENSRSFRKLLKAVGATGKAPREQRPSRRSKR
jgi:Domain of unknown function (DUF4276)